MSKPGRNSPYPCGSGTKFKRCHGAPMRLDFQHTTAHVRHEARERRRREQQGLGKPSVSTQMDDLRVVIVGSQSHAHRRWQTFHDFFRNYRKMVLSGDWWRSEERKSGGSTSCPSLAHFSV